MCSRANQKGLQSRCYYKTHFQSEEVFWNNEMPLSGKPWPESIRMGSFSSPSYWRIIALPTIISKLSYPFSNILSEKMMSKCMSHRLIFSKELKITKLVFVSYDNFERWPSEIISDTGPIFGIVIQCFILTLIL